MSQLYSGNISFHQAVGKELRVNVYGITRVDGETRDETFSFLVAQPEVPEDLRDFLRMALATACESL